MILTGETRKAEVIAGEQDKANVSHVLASQQNKPKFFQ
jgi:hypothetical protein